MLNKFSCCWDVISKINILSTSRFIAAPMASPFLCPALLKFHVASLKPFFSHEFAKLVKIALCRYWLVSPLLKNAEHQDHHAYSWCAHHGGRRGVVVSGVRQWTKLTHVGPGYNWDGWPSSGGYTISGCNQPTRLTQPCIPLGLLNRVPASAGVKSGMSPLPGGR